MLAIFFINGIPISDNNQYLKTENNIPTPSNSLDVAYSENKKIMAVSRVPIPPMVTGINPIKIAIGILAIVNSNGISILSA